MNKEKIKELIRLDAERSKVAISGETQRYVSTIKEISKIVKITQSKC